MNIEPAAKFFKDARSIWVGILGLISIAVWAGDTRYLTIAAADTREKQQIRREIADLQVRKGFAENEKDRKMYDTLIKVKENQIKSISGE